MLVVIVVVDTNSVRCAASKGTFLLSWPRFHSVVGILSYTDAFCLMRSHLPIAYLVSFIARVLFRKIPGPLSRNIHPTLPSSNLWVLGLLWRSLILLQIRLCRVRDKNLASLFYKQLFSLVHTICSRCCLLSNEYSWHHYQISVRCRGLGLDLDPQCYSIDQYSYFYASTMWSL